MQSSLLPYWESVYALFLNGWWFSPRKMIKAYAIMVSRFAGNTLRATQLVNNNILANMYAFKRTVEQTKESGNDLARACVNLAKKWRDSIKMRIIISLHKNVLQKMLQPRRHDERLYI